MILIKMEGKMKTLKKIFCFFFDIFVKYRVFISIKVQALNDINIISTTKVTAEEAKIWAKRKKMLQIHL